MEETKILLENLKADIIKGKENKMNPNYFHERLLNIKASLKKEPNRYMVYDFNNAAIDIQSEYNKGNSIRKIHETLLSIIRRKKGGTENERT